MTSFWYATVIHHMKISTTKKRLTIGLVIVLLLTVVGILASITPQTVEASVSIPLTVREAGGITRTNESVTTGIPLPTGTARTGWSLWDGATEIPLQTTSMDGTGNWMLLDFQTSVATNASKTLELRDTAPTAVHAMPIAKTETSTQIDLDTGPLELTIKKNAFNLFESIGLNGSTIGTSSGSNVTLTDQNGTVFNANAAAPTSLAFEYDGPLRKTLRVDGPFTGWSGMGYTLRLSVYAGSSQAKMEFIVRNSLQANFRNVHIRSARLTMGAGSTLVRSTVSGSMVSAGYPAGGLAYDLVTAADASGNNGTVVADWSYYGGTILVDFANPGSIEMTRQLNAAKTPLMALASARWFSDYGDLSTKQFGTLEDERAVYRNWGLTWSGALEPTDASKPDYRIGWEDTGVHNDLENDDVWQNLLMYLRTDGQQIGYFHRARAWARYFQWEYAFRTDGFEYAWDSNYEYPQTPRPDLTTGLTAADQSYIDANYTNGKHDIRGAQDFGGDHTFGYGLADWYHVTGERSTLDAMTDISEAVWKVASRRTPGFDAGDFDIRLPSRWLLMLQRQHEMNPSQTWTDRRDHAAELLRLTPSWNATWGTYVTHYANGTCTNLVEQRGVSTFQMVWAAWAQYRYYLDTGATWARDRLIANAEFVRDYAVNPTTGFAANGLFLDCRSTGDILYQADNRDYQIHLTDILTIAARLDGDRTKLDRARQMLTTGMCGVFSAPTGQVCSFVNRYFLSSNISYYNNGHLHSTQLLLHDAVDGPIPQNQWIKLPGTYHTPYWAGWNKSIILADGRYWSMEGTIPSGDTSYLSIYSNGMWSYDRDTNGWTRLQLSPWNNCNTACQLVDASRRETFPPDRHPYGFLAYAPDRDTIVLHGGVCSRCNWGTAYNPWGYTGDYADTWEYTVSTNTWTQFTGPPLNQNTRPSHRQEGSMEYDPSTGKVFLFGGLVSPGSKYGEHWLYDLTTHAWSLVTPANTPAPSRTGDAKDYDSTRQKIIVFGGETDYDLKDLNDLWEFDVATRMWTQLIPADGIKPSSRKMTQIAYDPDHDVIMVQGGQAASGAVKDTWIWNFATSKWTQVVVDANGYQSKPMSDGLVYDTTRKAFMYDGCGPDLDVCIYQYGDAIPVTPDTTAPSGITDLLAQ